MPNVTYESAVDAPVDVIWNLLLDKMEHPDRYLPGVSAVKILERSDASVLRQITTNEGDVLTERLVSDERRLQVTATLVGHPVYAGSSVCELALLSGGPMLKCELRWSPIDGAEPVGGAEIAAAVRQALQHCKQLAESRAAAPPAVSA